MDKCIWGIFPIESKVVLRHSWEVVILETGERVKMTTILSHEVPGGEIREHEMDWVAKALTNPAETEPLLVVNTSKGGLLTIERILTIKWTQMKHPAESALEICNILTLYTLVTNSSEKPVVLHEHTCIAIGISPPEYIVAPKWTHGSKPEIEVNAVHYKRIEDCGFKWNVTSR